MPICTFCTSPVRSFSQGRVRPHPDGGASETRYPRAAHQSRSTCAWAAALASALADADCADALSGEIALPESFHASVVGVDDRVVYGDHFPVAHER